MLAGVERLRQVQQGAAARHAHELCGGHRLRSGEAVAAGGIARVRSAPPPSRVEREHFSEVPRKVSRNSRRNPGCGRGVKGTNMKENLKEANEILGIKDDGSIAHQLSTLLTELDFDM